MTTTLPLITAFRAGLIGLLEPALDVVRLRRKFRVGLGDGGQPELTGATRVFGNFAEQAALRLLMAGLLDVPAGPRWLIHACGSARLVGPAVVP